jgi:hypothetical protein
VRKVETIAQRTAQVEASHMIGEALDFDENGVPVLIASVTELSRGLPGSRDQTSNLPVIRESKAAKRIEVEFHKMVKIRNAPMPRKEAHFDGDASPWNGLPSELRDRFSR